MTPEEQFLIVLRCGVTVLAVNLAAFLVAYAFKHL